MVGSEGGRQRCEPKRRRVSRLKSLAHSAMALKLRAPERAAQTLIATTVTKG